MVKTVDGSNQEIKIGEVYTFGELWDGEWEGDTLLEDGTISPDNENVVAFEILKRPEKDFSEMDVHEICDIEVRVTDIY